MRIEWYFDVISPFAWLQWPAIRQLCSEQRVQLRPILLAGLLDRYGHKGPAEIPRKRQFTYRHALWRARRAGLPLRFPPQHPFNPIPALRLCIAAGEDVRAVQAVMSWIWGDGKDAGSIEALTPLATTLGLSDPAAALAQPQVKARLRENFDAALAAGVFGVPSLVVDGDIFWGEDATEFARERMRQPALFTDPEYRRLDALPVGIERKPNG